MSVAIIVSPCGTGAESAAANTGALGHILELAVAKIPVQHVAAVAGDVQVEQAVIIVVGDCQSHAPAFPCKSCSLGEVGELSVRTLVIKRYHGISAGAI